MQSRLRLGAPRYTVHTPPSLLKSETGLYTESRSGAILDLDYHSTTDLFVRRNDFEGGYWMPPRRTDAPASGLRCGYFGPTTVTRKH